MQVKTYRIADLKKLVTSDSYLSREVIPVSPERAVSYMHNPRASAEMPVLFTLEDDGKLVAYRSLLPDYFISEGNKIGFAWLSGNYVRPDYRRQGLSTKLFMEVEDAWKGMLMYTNYAPASKAVYDRTDSFKHILSRPGRRYYARSMLYQQLKDRTQIGPALKLVDAALNFFHHTTSGKGAFALPEGVEVNQIPIPQQPKPAPDHSGNATKTNNTANTELSLLIQSEKPQSLFQRDMDEFNWICTYPWLTTDPDEKPNGDYHFSRIANRFENTWYYLESEQEQGFLWLKVVNRTLSVPYYFSTGKTIDVAARQVVLNTILEQDCDMITIRHPELGPLLGTRTNPFIYSKKMPQHYFAHTNLAKSIPGDKNIFDGDGDCVFT